MDKATRDGIGRDVGLVLSSMPRSPCSGETQSLNAAQGPIPAALAQVLRYRYHVP